jgi:hypothetical protein
MQENAYSGQAGTFQPKTRFDWKTQTSLGFRSSLLADQLMVTKFPAALRHSLNPAGYGSSFCDRMGGEPALGPARGGIAMRGLDPDTICNKT